MNEFIAPKIKYKVCCIEEILTLDFNNSVSFYYSQFGCGNTGVVARIPDICQHQHIFPYWNIIVRSKVLHSLSPLHERHRTAHSHTGDVQISSVLHFVLQLRTDGEMGRYAAH